VPQETIAPREDARFGPLKAKAEESWRAHNLKLMRLLEKDGVLDQRLDEAAERAILTLNQAHQSGMTPDQAREMAYNDLLQPEPSE
jgi:hypothetical protein